MSPSSQGQRSLSRCSGKYFQQELVTPTTTAAFHDDAFFTRMLFQQRQRQSIEPGTILPQLLVPNPRLILAVDDVQTPMTTILDTPVTPHGMCEPLHAHFQTADVIANLDRLFAIANGLRHHHADRFQTRPQLKTGQTLRRRQLKVTARLVTPMPRFAGVITPNFHARKIVLALLGEVSDDTLMQGFLVALQ